MSLQDIQENNLTIVEAQGEFKQNTQEGDFKNADELHCSYFGIPAHCDYTEYFEENIF